MKYRDIAKRWIYNFGCRVPITAEAGAAGYNESGRNFTDGQLDKANTARLAVVESLAGKWDIEKKERKDYATSDASHRALDSVGIVAPRDGE